MRDKPVFEYKINLIYLSVIDKDLSRRHGAHRGHGGEARVVNELALKVFWNHHRLTYPWRQ
jgi:hypothetical protein